MISLLMFINPTTKLFGLNIDWYYCWTSIDNSIFCQIKRFHATYFEQNQEIFNFYSHPFTYVQAPHSNGRISHLDIWPTSNRFLCCFPFRDVFIYPCLTRLCTNKYNTMGNDIFHRKSLLNWILYSFKNALISRN